jgi:hypothetical protein
MKKRTIIIFSFLALVTLSGYAQRWRSPYARAASNAGWQVGVYGGLPYFWGDFTSIAADKTYTGYLVGLQAGYQFNALLGMSLTLDYAANKAGARDYALDYLLATDGMTYYLPQPFETKRYGDLYARITMVSAGLHVDVNVNRIFGRAAANAKLKLIVSPAVYLQRFNPVIYTKADDLPFTTTRLNKAASLALGGDAALRYDLNAAIGIQLKGTVNWITDNHFDNIATVGHVQQNALWSVAAGLVWKISY